MVSARVLAAAGLGLALSACGYSHTTEVVRPPPAAVAYAAPVPVTTTYVTPAPVTYVTPTPAVPAAYYPPAITPPAGVEAFRDEYGFRYDGQGNRLDRYGNIISPYSTRP
ncbi:MAG: hypothetical protein AB7F22_18660 [Reyranella sp.]|uniref:hypothetical protein n=1 Tax=Reyranella sp. TaxID=1929291 RepID=UPI003D0FFD8F